MRKMLNSQSVTATVRQILLLALLGSMTAPRLLIGESEVLDLRRVAPVKGSVHEEMLRRLCQRVEAGATPHGARVVQDGRAYPTTMAAFLYPMIAELKYGAMAYDALRPVDEEAGQNTVLPGRGDGSARATVGAGPAHACDRRHDASSGERSRWMELILRASFDAWLTVSHASVEVGHPGSRWVAACRGGELMEMLALRPEKELAERHALIKRDLLQRMGNFDDLDLLQEGIGNTAYSGTFLPRALFALRSMGHTDLEAEPARHTRWKLARYCGSFADEGGAHAWLTLGVRNSGIGDEDWASLLLAFTPRDQVVAHKRWYKRHLGQLRAGSIKRRFDPEREGPVWVVVCHPTDVTERDPGGVHPAAVVGSGALTFNRNRRRNADDTLFSLHVDMPSHSHAQDQPKAFSDNLLAHRASSAGGAGKMQEPRNFTPLQVVEKQGDQTTRGTTGKRVSFTAIPRRGTAVVAGGSQDESLAVEGKHIFSGKFLDGYPARVQIRNQVLSPTPHRDAWQMNVGDRTSNGGIRSTDDFVLTAAQGLVPGEELAPSAARAEPDDRLSLDVDGMASDLQIDIQGEPLRTAERAPRTTVILPGGVPLAFVTIPPGSFRRGSPETEVGRDPDEGPQHEVTISRSFQLGVYEVTQRQWKAVMGDNPAVFQQPPAPPMPMYDPLDRPVESVSWQDVQRFLDRLNALGLGRFRLPTEAEWEYAARGGATTAYPWGEAGNLDQPHDFAWANSRSFATTHAVGLKPPNPWGLHDMHGNVWEWCSDWYGPYSAEPRTDPVGPSTSKERVFRGGSWYDFPPALRSANRHRHAPDGRYTAIGFRIVKEMEDEHVRTVMLPGGVALRLVRIPAGRFLMGSPDSEVGRAKDEGPLHEVTISRPFWMGAYEVTQQQWSAVMGSNPSTFQQGEDASLRPVERVSWNDVQQFLARLNALGLGRFRLPTEAEWEYAARAGSTARFAFGDDPDYRALADHAWFYSRAEGRSHPVGGKRPNALGLYDMYGNVWEWCADWFGPYSGEAVVDPQVPATGRERVIRGGSWFNEPEALRSANRHRHPPESRQTNLGLRLLWSK